MTNGNSHLVQCRRIHFKNVFFSYILAYFVQSIVKSNYNDFLKLLYAKNVNKYLKMMADKEQEQNSVYLFSWISNSKTVHLLKQFDRIWKYKLCT